MSVFFTDLDKGIQSGEYQLIVRVMTLIKRFEHEMKDEKNNIISR